MDKEMQQRADVLYQAALDESGARDPREYYRERLKGLKEVSTEAYDQAVSYYRDELIPSIANGSVDPVGAWLKYGKLVAELTVPGKAVLIDRTGRSAAHEGDGNSDEMILHIPSGKGGRAVLVGLPSDPSSAQMATFDLLVQGKQKLREMS